MMEVEVRERKRERERAFKMLCTELCLEDREEALNEGCKWPTESGKGQEIDSPPERPPGLRPADSSILGLPASRTVRE